jgi:hypothetical protein
MQRPKAKSWAGCYPVRGQAECAIFGYEENMLNETTIATFKSSLRGELIKQSDTRYDTARKVYNGMIDRRPLLIANCADVADVITAVKFGREHKLVVSIRGGGHNAAGLSVCDDGLVIDLGRINYVHADPKNRTVLAGGGALWGDVDHAAHAFGLAVPAGIISTTGVGGLTLGGGIGHLTRQCGLTVDNLLSVDMVLADGRFVTASAKENPDLFWAVRGGGGNFGRSDAVVVGGRGGNPALVSRLHRQGAQRAQRVFRVPDRAAGRAVPDPPAQQKNVRGRVVLHRPS